MAVRRTKPLLERGPNLTRNGDSRSIRQRFIAPKQVLNGWKVLALLFSGHQSLEGCTRASSRESRVSILALTYCQWLCCCASHCLSLPLKPLYNSWTTIAQLCLCCACALPLLYLTIPVPDSHWTLHRLSVECTKPERHQNADVSELLANFFSSFFHLSLHFDPNTGHSD